MPSKRQCTAKGKVKVRSYCRKNKTNKKIPVEQYKEADAPARKKVSATSNKTLAYLYARQRKAHRKFDFERKNLRPKMAKTNKEMEAKQRRRRLKENSGSPDVYGESKRFRKNNPKYPSEGKYDG